MCGHPLEITCSQSRKLFLCAFVLTKLILVKNAQLLKGKKHNIEGCISAISNSPSMHQK